MRCLGVCGAVVLAAAVVGCSKQEEITRYRVERVDTPVAAKPTKGPPASVKPQQFLGGIFLREKKAWFFKASGSPAELAKLEPAYQSFLKSVTFGDDGNPKWELPTEWRQLPGNEIRLATLRLGEAEDAPEATVIGLDTSDGDQAKYLLDNVNRWRKQLQLGPWTADEMNKELKTEKAGDAEFSYVSLTGTSDGGGMTPPFAGGQRPPRTERPTEPPAAAELQFKLPEGWKQVPPASPITKAAFRAGEKDGLEVTITVLGGAAGGLTDNINRWRGQVKLPPVTEEELLPQLKEITVDGVSAQLVEIVAETDAVLGVIAIKDGKSWFVKAKGPAAVASAEKERFSAFAESLKLP